MEYCGTNDYAGHRIGRHVLLPGSWNHLLYVMILNTRETLLTVPMGLVREYSSQYDYYYATLSAGLLLIIIPIAIVYIPFQKYYASGLTMGAVKG